MQFCWQQSLFGRIFDLTKSLQHLWWLRAKRWCAVLKVEQNLKKSEKCSTRLPSPKQCGLRLRSNLKSQRFSRNRGQVQWLSKWCAALPLAKSLPFTDKSMKMGSLSVNLSEILSCLPEQEKIRTNHGTDLNHYSVEHSAPHLVIIMFRLTTPLSQAPLLGQDELTRRKCDLDARGLSVRLHTLSKSGSWPLVSTPLHFHNHKPLLA